jgi:hypothetical protein
VLAATTASPIPFEPTIERTHVFTWFDLAWPWIGLGFAGVLVVLLFATNLLRRDRSLPRHRDLRWLAFLAVAVYMVHNVEEYGIAADGVLHAFPDALCTTLGQPAYPGCGIPPTFFLFVNLPLIWIAGPVAALLSRRMPLVGLTLWGVTGVNAVVHVAPAIALREYDPGLVTAVVLFIPLTAMAFTAAAGRRGPYRRRAMVVLLGSGVLMHAVLAGSILLFLRGTIPEWLLLAAQPLVIAAGYGIVRLAEPRVRRRALSD